MFNILYHYLEILFKGVAYLKMFFCLLNIGNMKEALLKGKLHSVRFIATLQRAISSKAERVINIHRGVRFDSLFRHLIAPICSLQRKKLSLDAENSSRLKGVERNYTNTDISAEKKK